MYLELSSIRELEKYDPICMEQTMIKRFRKIQSVRGIISRTFLSRIILLFQMSNICPISYVYVEILLPLSTSRFSLLCLIKINATMSYI